MKISEVSEKSGLSVDTLRYYERIGLLPPISRNKGGIRDYSDLDVRRIEFIKCMRSAGLPVEVLIKYYGLVQQGDATMETRKQILADQREELLAKKEEIQKTLDIIDHKLEVYDSLILERERAIAETEVQKVDSRN